MPRLGAFAIVLLGCGSRTGLGATSGEAVACAASPISVLVTGPAVDAHELLVGFDPPSATFGAGASVPCLGPGPPLPTVLAVDHAGTAFIAGSSIDTHLFRVDRATGRCASTGFQPTYTGFGLAYVADAAQGETLYAVEAGNRLVRLDATTFSETGIGTLDPGMLAVVAPTPTAPVLLAGDGAGDLFRFDTEIPAPPLPPLPPSPPPSPPGAPSRKLDGGGRSPSTAPATSGTVWRVDRGTAAETVAWALPARSSAAALGSQGFARWGGDFYFFEQAPGGSEVWRFRPDDGSLAFVARTNLVVLGAGAPPCTSP